MRIACPRCGEADMGNGDCDGVCEKCYENMQVRHDKLLSQQEAMALTSKFIRKQLENEKLKEELKTTKKNLAEILGR